MKGGLFRNITDDTLIQTGVGKVFGFIVNSHTNGTLQLVDSIDAYNGAPTPATGTLTFTGVVSDGELVTIGTEIYEFDTDASVGAGNILVDVSGGATAPDAVTALVAAITASSALVTAVDGAGDTVVVSTIATGYAANGLAVSTDCANASWGAGTLTGGQDTDFLILNTYTFPTGSSIVKFAEPINFTLGLYVDLLGTTADLTIVYI